jgi:TPR repeat protein
VAFLPCNADDFSTTQAKAEQGDAVAQFKLGVMYEYGPIAPHRPIEIETQEHAHGVLLCFIYGVGIIGE